jgi:hypothetical protein
MIDQRADILGTFAQRWQAQRHNIQPVKQVFAEQSPVASDVADCGWWQQ